MEHKTTKDGLSGNATMSIEEEYRATSPRSAALFEAGKPFMPGGAAKGAYYYKPYPLTMDHGEGCYLYDVDGRRFVDYANHHTAQILGHNHPAVMEAVRQQMECGIALGAPTGIEARQSEEMCKRVATVERIRFTNSGTEATLHAIRLARGFSKKPKIAKFEGGYHGSHDAVEISVAPPLDKAGPATDPVPVPGTGGISPRAMEEVVLLPYNDEASVERLVSQHRDELACVIFDPKAGILDQRKEFVSAVREITRKHGVLLIFDEIVGFRVGRGGMQEYFGIAPDLTTYGKIVGGGFPVGAFGGRADIMDLLDNTKGPTGFGQSGTFSAHPLTMTAGWAMLRQLTPAAFAHLNSLGDQLRTQLNDLFKRKQIKAKAVGQGSLFSIHFTDEEMHTYRALARTDKALAHKVFLALMQEGYYLTQGISMCSLSLPMESSHIEGLVAAVDRAIERAMAE